MRCGRPGGCIGRFELQLIDGGQVRPMKHRGTEGSHLDQFRITEAIVGAAIEVHRQLGPGLLESAYQRCMLEELRSRGLRTEAEVPLPLIYKNVRLDCGYRLDLVVAHAVIIELKALEKVPTVAFAQLLSYLRLTDRRVGLLINFHVSSIRNGIRRVVNG